MPPRPRFRLPIAAGLLAACLGLVAFTAPAAAQGLGAVAGTVVSGDTTPLRGVRVVVRAGPSGAERSAVTDARGAFLILGLAPGSYDLVARGRGFEAARLDGIRIAAGDTAHVRIQVTASIVTLSTVRVAPSATAVDALQPAAVTTIPGETVALLPTARDAASAAALIPGAKDGRLWGGAGAATNDFRLDGVSLNHPGDGGDLLRLPRDWVELVEVRGPGAGAAYGDFQGGVVDLRTRTGGSTHRRWARALHDAAALSASNLTGDEVGSEPAGRTELGAEVAGPVAERLTYFGGVQFVAQQRRAPALRTTDVDDHLAARQRDVTIRAMTKATWARTGTERLDVSLGVGTREVRHAGLDGLDDASALPTVTEDQLWYHLAWRRTLGERTTIELRGAGVDGTGLRRGPLGSDVPAVQPLRAGLQPTFQNPAFTSRTAPRTHTVGVALRRAILGQRLEHALSGGLDFTGATWRERHDRTGGLTWRPYDVESAPIVPTDASTWTVVGSDWGGEVRLGTATQALALHVEDAMTFGSRLAVVAGVRVSWWDGWLVPCAADPETPSCAGVMRGVRSAAIDPRLGVAWDVTGQGTLAVKASLGRYHQAMYARLFDRVRGANAYTDSRFHYTAPPVTDARQSFTAAERDLAVGPSGFSPFYDVRVLSEAGDVRGYRQPFVDQFGLVVERRLSTRWKAALLALHRRNGDIVGLVDRNRATNYTVLTDIAVSHRLVPGAVLDANGSPLVLDRLVVSNRDLIDAVLALNANQRPGTPPRTFAGWGPDDIVGLTWDPVVELAAIPEARRRYDQVTATLTAEQPGWRGEASITVARLLGNVPGVTGHGATGTGFTAGPFVRPNESINAFGILPDATEFEAKLWAAGRLGAGFSGGLVLTHILGERTTPSFTIDGKYNYRDAAFVTAPDALLRDVLGHRVLVEPRGSRHYASRMLLDVHVERAVPLRAGIIIISADLFNAFGSRAVTRVKTEIDDQATGEPRSYLGAPRERVAPRALRVGLRIGP